MTEKLGGNYVEESEVFEGSKNLKAIYVHKANEKYKSINGVMYEKCRGYMYLAENYKPEQVGRCYERVWIRGFDKDCKNCDIYVHKKSPLAKMLDKKKIEYDVY